MGFFVKLILRDVTATNSEITLANCTEYTAVSLARPINVRQLFLLLQKEALMSDFLRQLPAYFQSATILVKEMSPVYIHVLKMLFSK